MTLEEVKTLMETMAKTGLTCLDWESTDGSLHLERQPSGLAVNSEGYCAQSDYSSAENTSNENIFKKPNLSGAAADRKKSANSSNPSSFQDNDYDDSEQSEAEDLPGTVIKSPVVGIYYSSPSPDSDPFISVGSKIEAGTTLCIIEAMKLMNEVTSSFDGEIAEILVENGQRVEFSQPLFRII